MFMLLLVNCIDNTDKYMQLKKKECWYIRKCLFNTFDYLDIFRW